MGFAAPLSQKNPFLGKSVWEFRKMQQDGQVPEPSVGSFGAFPPGPAKPRPVIKDKATSATAQSTPLGKGNAPASEWERERLRLAEWEKKEQKEPLSHLAAFLGKASVPSAAEAAKGTRAAVVEQAAKQKAEEQRVSAAARVPAAQVPVDVPNPAFDDHDSAEFTCDSCGKKRPRAGFRRQQLLQLSDCEQLRNQREEGPWRGKLMRVNECGYGFVHCIQLSGTYERDIFMQGSIVERLAGGRRPAQELTRSGSSEVRVEFTIDKDRKGGKVCVKDARRIVLTCNQCELLREGVRVPAAPPPARPLPPSAAALAPLMKGFDPHARVSSTITAIRSALAGGASNPAAVLAQRLRGVT